MTLAVSFLTGPYSAVTSLAASMVTVQVVSASSTSAHAPPQPLKRWSSPGSSRASVTTVSSSYFAQLTPQVDRSVGPPSIVMS